MPYGDRRPQYRTRGATFGRSRHTIARLLTSRRVDSCEPRTTRRLLSCPRARNQRRKLRTQALATWRSLLIETGPPRYRLIPELLA